MLYILPLAVKFVVVAVGGSKNRTINSGWRRQPHLCSERERRRLVQMRPSVKKKAESHIREGGLLLRPIEGKCVFMADKHIAEERKARLLRAHFIAGSRRKRKERKKKKRCGLFLSMRRISINVSRAGNNRLTAYVCLCVCQCCVASS